MDHPCRPVRRRYRGKQPGDVQPLAESLVQPLAAESLQQQLGQPLAESLQHVQPLADSLEHGQPQPSAESNQQQDVQPEDVQPENVQPMVVRRRHRGKQPPRSQSLAQPLRKRSNKQERSWAAGRRVQYFGQRLMCSRGRASELKQMLEQERKKQTHWTVGQWKAKVKQIGKLDWGALRHGGKRRSGALAMGKHSASVEKVEQAVIGGASAIVVRSAVGESLEAIDKQSSIVGNSAVDEPSSGDIPLPSVLPALASGQKRLGGYNVIEILNSGSYGDVYKASRKGSGEMFAVKVMRKRRETAVMTGEQCRELSLMKTLKDKHPNLMLLLGWRETSFDIQLFMPLYDLNLCQFIKRELVPPKAGKDIVLQVFSGVSYLQDRSILHRDIKPPNILMKCQPLAAVLGDFGCSREVLPGGLMDTNDQPMTPRMVTLWYRAPEILIKDEYGPYGLPSDLWSLGITFAELEKGYAPFQHKHELGMVATISASLCGYRVSMHSSVLLKRYVPDWCSAPSKCNWGFRYGQDFAELVSALLKVDPRYRITTSKASELAFFQGYGMAQPLAG